MDKAPEVSGPAEPKSPWPVTDEEIEADALADDENPPSSDAELAQARRVKPLKILRRQLALSQEAFAERYLIPLGTLRDWEQGASEPDGAGKAYVRAILGDPEGVARALRAKPRVTAAE